MVRHFWQTEGWRKRHRIRLTGSGDFLEGRCRCRAPSDRAVNDVGHRRPVKEPEVDIRCGGKFGDAVQNAWAKALGIDDGDALVGGVYGVTLGSASTCATSMRLSWSLH